jgi:hypothetical protein
MVLCDGVGGGELGFLTDLSTDSHPVPSARQRDSLNFLQLLLLTLTLCFARARCTGMDAYSLPCRKE